MCTGNTTHTQRKKIRLSVYPCVYREPGIKNDKKTSMSRFIPVYTGNTSLQRALHYRPAVYPCAYREHVLLMSSFLIKNGLSLCIQGTRYRICWSCYCIRFIPVHTGNTSNLTARHCQLTVYPCAYREHIYLPILIYAEFGLSLCIQGTHCHY